MIGVVNFFEMLDTSFITTLKTEEVGSSETSEHSSTLKSHPHGTGSKVKVRYSWPYALTEHHAMKVYWGVEVWLHAFLILALDGAQFSASRPGCFTPRERAPDTTG
jgi:hypothetical protein